MDDGAAPEWLVISVRRIARRILTAESPRGTDWSRLIGLLLTEIRSDFPDIDPTMLRRTGEMVLAEELHP